MRTIETNGDSELEQRLLTPASRDYDIKTDVVVIVVFVVTALRMYTQSF